MDRSYLSKEYNHLKSGMKYRILKSFTDYDGIVYESGEVVEFIGSNFVPYEDGLSLFFVCKGKEKQIRLQIRPEEQQEIVQNLLQYIS